MNDIAEGIGGAIEGALTGRAVEPNHGEGDLAESSRHVPEECANCGALVSSSYCPQCGQKRDIHRSLAAIGHDLIHGVLHLDGKFWLTLPLLTFKPGNLTRRYINGERAKFVSPMAMFLFSVFAMFAVFQMIGITAPSDLSSSGISNVIANTQEQAQADLEEAESMLTQHPEGSPEHAQALSDRAAAQEALQGMERASIIDLQANPDVKLTGIPAIDEGLVKKWGENPGLMLYKLQANAYKFSWLLIPLSIPFVWLIFAWRRRFKAYDHAIFVTYSLAFTSMLFIVVSSLMTIESFGWIGALLLIFVPPIHLYKHLRGTYELSRFSAFWRLMVLSAFIWLVVILFLQTLLLLGAF